MQGESVIAGMLRIAQSMREGDFRECDAAVLITRDKETGILTFVYPGIDEREGQELLKEAAGLYGYAGGPECR